MTDLQAPYVVVYAWQVLADAVGAAVFARRLALWSGVARMQMSGWLFLSGPLAPPVL